MPGRLVHTLFKVIRDYSKLPDLRFSSITGEFVRDSLVGVGEEWLRAESGGSRLSRVEGRQPRVEGRGRAGLLAAAAACARSALVLSAFSI